MFFPKKNHINEQTRADLVSTKMFFLSEKKQYQQVLKKNEMAGKPSLGRSRALVRTQPDNGRSSSSSSGTRRKPAQAAGRGFRFT
jgi:hypothetical protein